MKILLHRYGGLLGLAAICLFSGTPQLQAAPLLAIDFNAGTAQSPTEDGFQPFADVSNANQTGPVTGTFTGLDSVLSSGTVAVTVAAGTSPTSTGTLTSRDRPTMAGPEFPSYYLYRDFVTTSSGPITLGINGLAASRSYQVKFYLYDNSNSRSFTITNYTTGSAGTTTNHSWTAGYAFSASTSPDVFAITQTATSSAAGELVFRITRIDGTNTALLSGLSIGTSPATWYLTTNQANSDNWSSTYLSHWNSSVGGGGSNPSSIHVGDNFVHGISGHSLRTLGGASTFRGGELTINGSAKLVLKTTNTAHVSTIPRLTTGGGVIEQGYAGIVQKLTVDRYLKNSGTTSLTAGSGRGIDLRVGLLAGSSAFTLSGGGNFRLNFAEAQDFTGGITLSSGTLYIEELLSTRGALTIANGTQVVLRQPGYFTSVSVGGTPLAAGIHSFASLQAAYPAIFTSGSASGALIVYSPANPTPMRGMNLAGGEFGSVPGTYGVSYKYPTAAFFDYYQGKGLTLMRVPFRWERVQPTLNTALDSTQLAYLDAVVDLAEARGMKVIFDMHNYGKHSGNAIGSSAVPISAYRDVWVRLADHFKGETAVYGYGLMNEPAHTDVWQPTAQEAVYGIRTVDPNTFVYVNGAGWGAAASWEVGNADLHVQDPVQRVVYEAHCYFDHESGGSYGTYEEEGGYPMIGVDRVRPFVTWLRATGKQGYVGEYGVPRGDSRWHTVLDNFLDYLTNSGVSGTYWAGGPGWGSSVITNPLATVCEPYGGVDAPQMPVIQAYP